MPSQLLPVGLTLRYPKPARPSIPALDGMVNFHHATRDERTGSKMAILESGINAMAVVQATDGIRRPAVLVRSSPARVGTERTPWEDVIDLDTGRLTYFGDHKPGMRGTLGSSKGNKVLEELLPLHRASEVAGRALAAPLLVFVTVPWIDRDRAVREKGAVQFLGLAVLEDMMRIRAVDERTGSAYPNYRTQLQLLDLGEDNEHIDWTWINQRKDPDLSGVESRQCEPSAWAAWRNSGRPR